MITLIYRAIVAFVLVFVVWNMYTEEKLMNQANAILIVIPMLLRLLMIK